MQHKKKLTIVGASSRLSQLLSESLEEYQVTLLGRTYKYGDLDVQNLSSSYISNALSVDETDFYIFNLGFLSPTNIVDLNEEDIITSLKINALFTIKASEIILQKKRKARILIIGSESGRKGSYDTCYFLAKAMLRAYVRQRYLNSNDQQLLLISPSTIEDSSMTIKRIDKVRLDEYRNQHPKKRFIHNIEIVNFIKDILSYDSTYICNTEIEMNGGKFSRMRYEY